MNGAADSHRPCVRAILPASFEDDFDPRQLLAAAAAAALAINAPLEVLILGASPDEVLRAEAIASNAASVWQGCHGSLASRPTAEQVAQACIEALSSEEVRLHGGDASLTLLPACDAGEELAARLAATLGGAALGRIDSVARLNANASGLMALRPAFGGLATASLKVKGPGYAVMRAAAGVAVPAQPTAVPVRRLDLNAPLPAVAPVVREPMPEGGLRLEGARIVVSGGRGMGGPEGFERLQALAEALGGALGGSLPTIDAGWLPVSRQVGQSGKFVRPELYVAVGISGTPQHLAGIAEGTRIVAINNDPSAAIFHVAEIGCVGDWHELLPLLQDCLRQQA